jgi:YggT family protein
MRIVCDLLTVIWLILVVRIIVGWILSAGWRPTGVARTFVDGLYRITEPIFRPVRGLLPMVRAGGMGIDFSPIIIFIVIIVLQGVLCT